MSFFSPQKDVDEDISQTSDPGLHNEEVASSSTTETDRKSKGKDSLASESQADSDGNVVGHPNSMDIEDPSEGSSGVSQPADGEPVSSTGQPASEAGVPDTTSILSVMDEIYKVIPAEIQVYQWMLDLSLVYMKDVNCLSICTLFKIVFSYVFNVMLYFRYIAFF